MAPFSCFSVIPKTGLGLLHLKQGLDLPVNSEVVACGIYFKGVTTHDIRGAQKALISG